jgi:hypothetical protein
MANRFTAGKRAISECDRCGIRVKLKDLKKLVIKTKEVAIKVCHECWEADHPQLQLGMYPVSDPQAVRDPRPDFAGYVQSRDIFWGWNPVGGSSGFDAALTPNPLAPVGIVGFVTVKVDVTPPTPPPPSGITFSFTVATASTTSAAVYDASNQLFLTLWSGESVPIGTNIRVWNGKDNGGNPAPVGTYTIKVLTHNVQYIWDGCVGNTSYIANDHQNIHTAFDVFSCMVPFGNNVYYSVGGNEGQPTFGGFANSAPQVNTPPLRFVDPFTSPSMMAIDSQKLYFVSLGGFGNTTSFVYALTMGSGSRVGFSSQPSLCLGNNYQPDGTCYPGQTYPGAILLNNGYTNVPSGIAVQQNGSILAVAMPSEGVIRRYNKTTGAALGSITTTLIANPSPTTVNGNPVLTNNYLNQIAMTPSGDLWVITSKTSVAKYTNLGTTPTLATSFSIDTVNPLAIAVDPTNGNIWIVDGDTSQQVQCYTSAGDIYGTLGDYGGSLGNAAVYNYTFNFYATPVSQKSAIAVDNAGSVWVTDSGNGRMLKFSGGASAASSIQYRGKSYNAIVDTGNPIRVFSNFMEFTVDYTKPLTDPSSWKLIKNWLPVIPPELLNGTTGSLDGNGFTNIVTLRNGRTYAQLPNGEYLYPDGTRTVIYVILELKSDGTVQRLPDIIGSPLATSTNPIGQYSPNTATRQQMYEDGSLGYAINENNKQKIIRLPIQEFDGSNNPVWGSSPVTLASIPLDADGWENTPQWSYSINLVMGPYFPMTTGSEVIYFNNSATRDGFHLGAVVNNGTNWNWQASPSGLLNGKGNYATVTYYPLLQYAGTHVRVAGKNIVYGYVGERITQDNQASQFMHFYDNGLFVGQFGVASWQQTQLRTPGFTGNAWGWNLASYNNVLYLYTCDESTFGAVNRWKIANTDTISVMSGSGATGSTIVLV